MRVCPDSYFFRVGPRETRLGGAESGRLVNSRRGQLDATSLLLLFNLLLRRVSQDGQERITETSANNKKGSGSME